MHWLLRSSTWRSCSFMILRASASSSSILVTARSFSDNFDAPVCFSSSEVRFSISRFSTSDCSSLRIWDSCCVSCCSCWDFNFFHVSKKSVHDVTPSPPPSEDTEPPPHYAISPPRCGVSTPRACECGRRRRTSPKSRGSINPRSNSSTSPRNNSFRARKVGMPAAGDSSNSPPVETAATSVEGQAARVGPPLWDQGHPGGPVPGAPRLPGGPSRASIAKVPAVGQVGPPPRDPPLATADVVLACDRRSLLARDRRPFASGRSLLARDRRPFASGRSLLARDPRRVVVLSRSARPQLVL